MFIMHIHRQTCRRCGAAESLSHLYEAEEMYAPGKAQKLLPATAIGPLDPVHKVELAPKTTPCCVKCVDDSILAAGADIYIRWQDTLKRKSQERAAPPTAHREQKERGTRLEDLA